MWSIEQLNIIMVILKQLSLYVVSSSCDVKLGDEVRGMYGFLQIGPGFLVASTNEKATKSLINNL